MPNPSKNSNFEQTLKDIIPDKETRDYLQRLFGDALMKLGTLEIKMSFSSTLPGYEPVTPHGDDLPIQVDSAGLNEEMERFLWDLLKKIQERAKEDPQFGL